tara:strand:- start:772 stop:1212 length:441 start_codon:yes stop_codon:yes gene_type:complete
MGIDLPELLNKEELEAKILDRYLERIKRGVRNPDLKSIAKKLNIPVGTVYSIVSDYQFNPKTSKLRHFTEEAVQTLIDIVQDPEESTKDRIAAVREYFGVMIDKENTADKGHFNLNISLGAEDKASEAVEIRHNELEASYKEIKDD